MIYFYPAAMTRGCTAENCHFRDLGQEFARLGAQAVGISADPVAKQLEFADRYELGVTLLSDPERKVARQFGVRRRFGPLPVKRWTYVLDQGGRVLDVVKSETRMGLHADQALSSLRRHLGHLPS